MRTFMSLFSVLFLSFFVISCSGDFSRLDTYYENATNFADSSASLDSSTVVSSETSPVFSRPLDSVESSPLMESSSSDIPDYASGSLDSGSGDLPASVEATVSSISDSSASSDVIDVTDSSESVISAPDTPETDDIGVPRRRYGVDGSSSPDGSSAVEVASVAPSTATEAVVSGSSSSDSLFRWPVEGRIIGNFGERTELGVNDGIDISAPEGTPVKAVEGGTVVYSGDELSDFGNLILLSHSDGWVSAYAHSSENRVRRGDTVTRGQVIALSGKTGKATTPKLHFELRRDSRPVDPVQYLER